MANYSKAEQGIRSILSKLDKDELSHLAITVTQGMLKKDDASTIDPVETIISYSPDFESILKRKVVTKNVLFLYAHETNIPVVLPATKNDLVDSICQVWELTDNSGPGQMQEPSRNCGSTTIISRPSSSSSSPQEIARNESSDANVLALKFTEWFYQMMNSTEPIDVQHFWEDVSLKLLLTSSSPDQDSVCEEVDGNVEQIVAVLHKTKSQHRLYFNPNLMKEGVQGRIDPHGLVIVLACGTLHVDNRCVGVFEQVFMLARDPLADNNWKIKRTELILRSSEVKSLPSLCDSNLATNYLCLPST